MLREPKLVDTPVRYRGMQRQLMTALSMAAVTYAVTASPASADFCMGAGQLKTVERARQAVPVVPNRSLGAIRLGMTRRDITRRLGAGRRTPRDTWTWKQHGLPIEVSFGRYGGARVLRASSNLLEINRVRLASGPDAIKAAWPGSTRGECDRTVYIGIERNGRQTSAGFFPEALPRVTLINVRMKR